MEARGRSRIHVTGGPKNPSKKSDLSSMRNLIFLAVITASLASAQDIDREVSWKQILPNILQDQLRVWRYPVNLAEGHAVLPTLAVAGAGAGLAWGADAPTAHYFRNTTAFSGFNRVFSGTATSLAILAAPASLYATGLLRKDPHMSDTAMLAGEAVADAEVIVQVLKPAVSRTRPSALPPNAGFRDTWEHGPRFAASNNSFPSGHAIAAFSVATVISRRYRNHRWVPYAAYGTAAAIAFSRVTGSDHYLADVFAGAVLGYSVSRFAVLPR